MVVTYASAPYLIERYLPGYLKSLGVEQSELNIGRPGLSGMSIHHLAVAVDGTRLEASDIELTYHLGGLLERRLDTLTIQQLAVFLTRSSADTSGGSFASPWALVPADHFDVESFEVISHSPDANVNGRLSLSPTDAQADLRINSEQLPAALDVTLKGLPTGESSIEVMSPGLPPVITIQTKPGDVGHVSFTGSLALDGETLGLISSIVGIDRPTGLFQGTFSGRSRWPPAGPGDINGSGRFSVDLAGSIGLFRDARLSGDVSASLVDELALNAENLVLTSNHIIYRNVRYETGNSSVRAGLYASLPLAAFNDPFPSLKASLEVDIIGNASSAAEQALWQNVKFDAGLGLNVEGNEVKASLASGSIIDILAGELDVGIEALNLIQMDVSGGGEVTGSRGLFSARFSVMLSDEQSLHYRAARLDIDSFLMTGDSFEAYGQFRSDGSKKALPVGFVVSGNLSDATVAFNINADHPINRPVIKNEFPGWVADYDLGGGQLNLSLAGKLDFSSSVQASAEGLLALEGGTGFHDDTLLKGIATRLPVSLTSDTVVIGPGPAQMSTADVGFAVTDINFQLETDTVIARIDSFSARALSADIDIDELVYDIDNESSNFEIRIKGLSVADLLALQGEDITGSGALDGQLPVFVTEAGTTIKDGQFSARAPGGYLRYHGDVPTANAGLDLALRALRNFEYNQMDIDVEYLLDGELASKIALSGSSPDVENGRQIHFNMNITQNIPVLLESIRSSDEFKKRIQQQLSQ